MKATAKKRVLVSLAPESRDYLQALAKARQEPVATVASRMIDAGLELEADLVLAEKAYARATRKGVTYVSHDKAWANFFK